jgi:hypothetical protein
VKGYYLLGVALAVAGCELLHESVDLLCFAGESESLEEETQRGHEVLLPEVHLVHVANHHLQKATQYFSLAP